MTLKYEAWLKGEGAFPAIAISFTAMLWLWLVFTFGFDVIEKILVIFAIDGLLKTGLNLLGLFGVLAAPIIIWSIICRRPLELDYKNILPHSFIGTGLGVFGVLICLIYSALSNNLMTSTTRNEWDMGLFFICVFLTIIQAGSEEVVFRGFIQLIISRNFGIIIGLAVSSILFGLIHFIVGAALSFISLVNIILAGAFFGLLYIKTKSLTASIAAHFGWNWAEGSLFGLMPNPGIDVWGSVFDFDMIGSSLWGGSPEGLNASLAATFVLAALSIMTFFWTPPSFQETEPIH